MPLMERAFTDAVNHVLATSPWATRRLVAFASSTLLISAKPVSLLLTISDQGHFVPAPPETTPDVTLIVPLGDLPAVLGGGMNGLMARVRIEGNAELADTLGFVFRNLRWDVEEDLSRLVGDIPAHRIAASASKMHQAQLRGAEAFAGNLREYLTEESGLLVNPGDLTALREAVTSLRDGVARVEKRIERLSRANKGVPVTRAGESPKRS